MEFSKVIERAMEVREQYDQLNTAYCGRPWNGSEIATGFVGDVGALMKLILAKDGVREIPDADKKFEHELSDCFWSILVLANKYGIDLEKTFFATMDELTVKISKKLASG